MFKSRRYVDVSNSMMIAAQSEAGAGVVNGRGTKSFDELAREGITI